MNRARQERAEQITREAENMRLNPHAFTAARDVAETVQVTQATLNELRARVNRPYEDLMTQIGLLGSVLSQLSDGIAALQAAPARTTRVKTAAPPRKPKP